MKKVLHLLIVAALIASAGTGCGTKKQAKSDAPEVSVMVFDTGSVNASEGTYEDNRWTKWINENSGVKVKWVPVNRNQETDKINALIASGSAPDILYHFNINYIGSLVNQGVLAPVGEYVDKYSTTYKSYISQHPELKKFTDFGGVTYSMTTAATDMVKLNHSIWIRQDWLDKLGLEMPKTDGELLAVARAFRDKDPDGNGVNDTVPIAAKEWYDIIPDMYNAGHRWYVNEDGSLEFGFLSDRFKDVLSFFKTLYDERLISPEFAIDKDFSMQKGYWVTGKTGMLMNQWPSATNEELMKNDPSAKPVILPPVTTKYGVGGYYKEPDASQFIVFNKDIKNPEAAIRFLDWLMDKGDFKLTNGDEGVHYKMVNNVPKVIDAEKNKTELNYAGAYAYLSTIPFNPDKLLEPNKDDEVSRALARQNYDSYQINSKINFRNDLPRSPDVEQFTNLMTEWGIKRDDIRINVITGGEEYTPEWGLAQLRAEWDKLGGQNVNKLVKEWYDANVK